MLYPLSYEGWAPAERDAPSIFSRLAADHAPTTGAAESGRTSAQGRVSVEGPTTPSEPSRAQEETAAARRPSVSSSCSCVTSGNDTFSSSALSVTLAQS